MHPRPSTLHRTIVALTIIALAPCFGSASGFLPGTSFHRATWGERYGALESTGSPDRGGLFYLFPETGEGDGTIAEVEISDSDGKARNFDGWFTLPTPGGAPQNGSDNFVTLVVKGIGPPLAEGESVQIAVRFANGKELTKTIDRLRTPPLRVANLVPSHDREALFLYLRNDGAQPVKLRELRLNRKHYHPGKSHTTARSLGGGPIAPGAVEILRIEDGLDLRANAPMAVRVLAENADGDTSWTSAGVRIVPPVFHLGSWHSSAAEPGPEHEAGRKRLRRIGVDLLQGPSDGDNVARMFRDYHMGVVRKADFGDPFDAARGTRDVRAHDGKTGFLYWTIDDEPDLFSKPIGEQLKKARVYRGHALRTPIHTNLAVQKKFQRYGWFADIVSMDHYAAPDAPNCIPGTWVPFVGRRAEIAEAAEYTDQLKRNTEPRRTWSWVQLAANVWDVQPEPAAIDYQFWAHISGGAKTVSYFVAKPRTKEEHPAQWKAGVRLYRVFKQIRNLCLYGEPAPRVARADHPSARARALAGPDAVVVTVLNDSIRFEGNQLTGYSTEWEAFDYELQLRLPPGSGRRPSAASPPTVSSRSKTLPASANTATGCGVPKNSPTAATSSSSGSGTGVRRSRWKRPGSSIGATEGATPLAGRNRSTTPASRATNYGSAASYGRQPGHPFGR